MNTEAHPPLRIGLLGWACLSLQEREGTGYNLHVSELAAALAEQGHHVSYLRSGMDYSLRPGMFTRAREVWRGVHCHDLVNSPVLSPGFLNFREPQNQIACPAITEVVLEWLQVQGVQLVHIHALEGFGFDLVAAIRAAGVPVLVTPHNYFFLCPQVDLLHKEVAVCEDYRGGERCLDCLRTEDPRKERFRRRVRDAGLIGNGLETSVRRTVRSIGSAFAGLAHAEQPAKTGREASPVPALRTRPATPGDMNARLLAANHHLRALNVYGDRRAAGAGALNAANAVLCPSIFLMNLHAAMGVNRRVLRHVPLGQPHFDALAAAAASSPYYHQRPWTPAAPRPLRFGFFGSTRYNKGLDVLCRAIAMLDDRDRARAHFHLRAGGDTSAHRAFLRDVPQASFLGGYTPADLPSSLGDFDVGVVPTTGLENAPFVVQEHLHAGKFVIGSKLGGPTDFIREPLNGLLVPASNPGALAQAMTALIQGHVAIPSPSEVRRVAPLRTHVDYLAELNEIYAAVCNPASAAHAIES